MGDVRLEETAVVLEDRLDRLRLLGCQRRKERKQRSRLDLRHDVPVADPAQVVGHDVDRGVSGGSEVGHVHVAQAGPLLVVQLSLGGKSP